MKKEKVYSAYRRDGMPTEQKPDVIVFFPDETLRKTPDPQHTAEWHASEILRIKIPNFKSSDWQTVEEEADLPYSTPNLVANTGAKVWYTREPTPISRSIWLLR
jgi:hypothetical protein